MRTYEQSKVAEPLAVPFYRTFLRRCCPAGGQPGLSAYGKARRHPVGVLLQLTERDVSVEIRQGGAHLADLAVADMAVIDLHNRSDADRSPREEHLVCLVELAAVDTALQHLQPELGRAQFDDRRAGDAFEN